jgi:prolipoprotein diacylglyceryltransferase
MCVNIAGLLTGTFAILYGIARFVVEFVREPDAQLGLSLWLSDYRPVAQLTADCNWRVFGCEEAGA